MYRSLQLGVRRSVTSKFSSYFQQTKRTYSFARESFALAQGKTEIKKLLPYVASATIASMISRRSYNFISLIWGLFRYVTQSERRRFSREGQRLASRGQLGPIALELRNIAAFRSYVKFWIEALVALVNDQARIDLDLTIAGADAVTDWLSTGKGAILATAHLGNPDWAGYAISSHIRTLTAIFAPLKPPIFEKWLLHFRTMRGMESIMLTDGSVARNVIEAINAGKLVAMACDFDIAGTALGVEFFSKVVPIASGPATISLRTKTPIFPGACFMTPEHGHFAKFLEPIFPSQAEGDTISEKILHLTQLVATALEGAIEAAPEQWHVVVPIPIEG